MEDLKENRILVTGGAGFIGSQLTRELLVLGHSVTVLDNLSSGFESNLPKHKSLSFIQGDVRDANLVDSLVIESDLVFHLAEYIPTTNSYGAGHVIKFSVDDPLQDFDVSTRGTLIVLNSAKKHQKKFLFTSTAAVYGGATFPLKEEAQTTPISPYGVSKLCAEEYVKLYNRIYELPTAIVRFFNVFGPRQTKYIMYDLLLKLKNNPTSLNMLGTGQELRDFIYVNDAVKALLLVAQSNKSKCEVYNVASGKARTIKEVVLTMLNLLEIDIEVEFKGSSWKGDVGNLTADTTKIASLGFRTQCDFTTGLKSLIDWFTEEMKKSNNIF